MGRRHAAATGHVETNSPTCLLTMVRVTGIEPALSAWESDSVAFPRPGRDAKLLVRRLRAYTEMNREAPI